MIKSVLVAIDGSDHARVAGEYAVGLAKAYDAKVVGAYVIDARILEMPPFLSPAFPVETIASSPSSELIATLREHGERALDAFRDAVAAEGVPVDVRVEEGVPGETLADLADAYDLLIMGKRGEQQPLGEGVLGSTAEEAARRSDTPVLLVDAVRRALSSVVLLYDGDHQSNAALKLAADVVSHLGATLTVVTAADDEETAGRIQEEARAYLSAFPGLVVHYRLRTGGSVLDVLDETDDAPADLVVMGRHEHSVAFNFFVGSTTDELMREVTAPLLLVP